MKWIGRRQSDNVEDRRGMSGGGKTLVGGGVLGIIILLLNAFGGENGQMIGSILQQTQGQVAPTEERALTPAEEKEGEFVKTLLADNEDVWTKIFQENNLTFEAPTLVLFSGQVNTACGGASSASGPFYCPGDRKIYMDMSFFNTLKDRFGAAGGDFAIAYVIAHEVGHHVQHQLGVLEKTHNIRRQLREAQGNQVQVATELQADYFAGVWAHYEQRFLETGDVEEAINAAAAVGDDNIQKSTQGYTRPETYTHGTSKQRVEWFSRGFKSGDLNKGDTFGELLN